ncbi:magnesium transporter CorA family protein [Paenibacillus sp. 1P07SE]|uniref:magnesium transporter CorA family protein n=1 Tax=Paenibacillus sp. 1P07SE TaxID=3132209 RepID=UPI0039A7149D
MTDELYRDMNGWKWYRIGEHASFQAEKLLHSKPELQRWYERINGRSSNYMGLRTHAGEQNALFGSIVVLRDKETLEQRSITHYYLTGSFLVTIGWDTNVLCRTSEQELTAKLDGCRTPLDGFFLLIGEALDSYMEGMDQFEEKLMRVESEMRQNNGIRVLDHIMECRYELLRWAALTLPMREILAAAKEVFMEEVEEAVEYKRTRLRADRIVMLEKQYEHEVETLLKMDDGIGSVRGNEIMKTLTVFTAVFTPVMALGALWGMNFEKMPELEWPWGYAAALVLILAGTVAVYWYLYLKGWTGDLLKHKRNKSVR